MASSKQLIERLLSKGLTKADIARAVKRDSSLISQIEKGKKPGANLQGALQNLLEGKAAGNVERRTTKAGKVASVRKSKKASERPLQKDKQGRIRYTSESARPAVLLNRIEKVAEAGGKVSFRVTYLDGDGNEQQGKLYEKGGFYAQRAQFEMLNHSDGAFGWVLERLNEHRSNSGGKSLPPAVKVLSVGVTASYGS